jgi:hypothetical protein
MLHPPQVGPSATSAVSEAHDQDVTRQSRESDRKCEQTTTSSGGEQGQKRMSWRRVDGVERRNEGGEPGGERELASGRMQTVLALVEVGAGAEGVDAGNVVRNNGGVPTFATNVVLRPTVRRTQTRADRTR